MTEKGWKNQDAKSLNMNKCIFYTIAVSEKEKAVCSYRKSSGYLDFYAIIFQELLSFVFIWKQILTQTENEYTAFLNVIDIKGNYKSDFLLKIVFYVKYILLVHNRSSRGYKGGAWKQSPPKSLKKKKFYTGETIFMSITCY